MKLTIIETGIVPPAVAGRFPSYPEMFKAMFERHGARLEYDVVSVASGAPLPDPSRLQAVLITGSSAGVYEEHP